MCVLHNLPVVDGAVTVGRELVVGVCSADRIEH